MSVDCPVPFVAGDYVPIYKPQPDVYTGADTVHYRHGATYREWQPNDHTFVKGPDGRWHCFGITRPCEVADDMLHEGEGLCFHALAPVGTLAEARQPQSWLDQPKLDVSGCGWAPFVVKLGETYSIIGSGLGRAESADLYSWTDRGRLAAGGGNRDPNVMFWNGTYYLVRCDNSAVVLVTSTDFVHWSEPVDIFRADRETRHCESPVLVHRAGWFYLFWCLWDAAPPPGQAPNPYDNRTFVYVSDTPTDFHNRDPVTQLQAHAPEVLQDEVGNWFISSADYPQRGVSLARLEWRE